MQFDDYKGAFTHAYKQAHACETVCTALLRLTLNPQVQGVEEEALNVIMAAVFLSLTDKRACISTLVRTPPPNLHKQIQG